MDGININIDKPGVVTILGPNGAGKTTLLKIITSLAKPQKGRVEINGTNIFDDRKKILSIMGALIEQPEFYTYTKGREILSFTGLLKGLRGEKLNDEIARVSSLTGSEIFLDKKVGKYSRGMKQRLGIAVALMGDPQILVLDEPTFGIDPIGSLEIRQLVADLNKRKEKIIVFTTHIIEEATKLSDRIIILNSGKVEYDASNREDMEIIKVVGILKEIPSGYNPIKISDEEFLFNVRKEELPEFNRLITSIGKIKYIERSSEVEETIRKISIKH